MTGWRWIVAAVVHAIHDEQLSEHGGAAGVRDIGLLESALARPQHLAAYEQPDVAQLAAAYAAGIVRNHPFVDGNKRTAFVVANVFLLDNGYDIAADDAEVYRAMIGLAGGSMTEAQFVAWLRQTIVEAS